MNLNDEIAWWKHRAFKSNTNAAFVAFGVATGLMIARADYGARNVTEDHKPLPVKGYTNQPPETIAQVNINKHLEETVLRQLDDLAKHESIDKRWLAVGRTHLEQAFMAINRSIFKPTRIEL